MSANLLGNAVSFDPNAIRTIANEIAAKHAADVDAQSRFPQETVDALKRAGFMSALVPKELGGAGCSMRELANFCATLAQACASSAMVLAMHYSQLACLVRHGAESPFFRRYLQDLVTHQYLLASMTSEVGTFGDTRSSICAVERNNGRFKLNKDATTGSYCAYADAILVTCRRSADAPASDQILVLVRKTDCELTQTTSWDTLGMRGTCSPGFRLESSGPEEQIVPGSFADSSAQSMVPYSHILWASLWYGIGADAVGRAAAFVRADARKKPGTVPPMATRLAQVSTELQAVRHNWLSLADEFDAINGQPDGLQELLSIGWALKTNNLKINVSEAVPQIVHHALQIIGIMGYKNDSRFSLGRQYRDALSGALMISNERIAAKNASMLLVFKDE
ncbi:MAG TPA: acyl-CoA dehydrogenase family protein [Povalibacter sp.]|uniref:acyl-CoA dehydrogenase family protein n=1 Tax=Povalibacter sp. TaxID=1962978 RepID=UPI002CC7B5DB|nr:acyl-CoA dehydrogenase family protein [Povalibacter sp.]HMN42990.1 acyl-CoA dehydrogenase family protein [Povalibacter sp.]